MPRLALIDRNRDSRSVCAALLEHYEHTVSCWDHWRDATAAAANEPFDLVLIDPGPVDEGWETLHARLSAHFPQQPVLIITGGVAGKSNSPFAPGNPALLTKPFSVPELLDAVNRNVAIPRGGHAEL